MDWFVVRLLHCVQLFVTPWTAARQASLSFTISQSLLKLLSTESVMPSNHLILFHPLLLLPSIFPSIRVFSIWVGSLHQVAKILKLQLQHQSFQWIFRVDLRLANQLLPLIPYISPWALGIETGLEPGHTSPCCPTWQQKTFFFCKSRHHSSCFCVHWLDGKPLLSKLPRFGFSPSFYFCGASVFFWGSSQGWYWVTVTLRCMANDGKHKLLKKGRESV